MKIQYNIRINAEDKQLIEEIAKEESKRGFNIEPSEVTRQALKKYIEDWKKDHPDFVSTKLNA